MSSRGGSPGRVGSRLRAGVSRWWRGEAGGVLWRGASVALAPGEAAYGAGVRVRNALYSAGLRRTHRVAVPVLSVGNLTVGGTGKTPVAGWLADLLEARGARVAVLHGGYAADEPELHRLRRPGSLVFAMRDRVAAARLAIAQGATVLVLDDGFQHRRLHRDLDLVLVPAESWTPRPRLLPRGPWREPPAALARAGAVAVVRRTASDERARRVAAEVATFAPGAIVARIHLRPAGWRSGSGEARAGGPKGGAVAVVGVAEPEQFLANAREAGADIEATLVFPDHHAYTRQDLERIVAVAGGRAVVTTAKDAVKLRALQPELDLWVLDREVVVEEGLEALVDAAERLLGPALARDEAKTS